MNNKIIRFLPVTAVVLLALLTPARAGAPTAPVAVVEDVGPGVAGIALFDFVEAGRVIDLGAEGRLVLGYISGCQREEISGGTVIVGTSGSTVEGGQVSRQTVECDGGGLQLTSAQVGKSGVQVVRAGEAGGAGEAKPALTIYGTSPLVLAAGAVGKAVFRRLDRDGEILAVALQNGIADLAKVGGKLARGGIYAISVGQRTIVVRIDRYARPGPEPLLSRLVRF